jgi:hypothetical protein
MFDQRFVTALATEIAARITPQLQRRNGATVNRLLSVKEAAAYIGRTEQALQHLIHKRNDLDRWIEANKD